MPYSSLLPPHLGEVAFRCITKLCALSLILLLATMAWKLVESAWPAISQFGPGFIISTDWDPVTDEFGAATALWGTVVSSLIAMLIAVPVSLGVAIFLTQVAPRWIKRPVLTAVELLAAIPSIIYGLWGLFVLTPWLATNVQPWLTSTLGSWPVIGFLFQGPPIGIGLFPAGLVLSVMIIPFMTSVICDLFATVPTGLKEASFGLGATRWEMITQIVLSYTRVGVVGSFMLGLGRALGETMAVTFVIGNAHHLSTALFEPSSTIASTLANEFTEASSGIYLSSLMYLGLVLFLLTFTVLALARLMLWRLSHRDGGGK